MTDVGTMSATPERTSGEDYTCDYCGCEITVKHAGDPARMPSGGGTFSCRCGTEMHAEHARGAGRQEPEA